MTGIYDTCGDLQNSAIGSGLAGFVCAVIAICTNQFDIMQTAFVASFGSKLSDTVSSEVGKGAAALLFFLLSCALACTQHPTITKVLAHVCTTCHVGWIQGQHGRMDGTGTVPTANIVFFALHSMQNCVECTCELRSNPAL